MKKIILALFLVCAMQTVVCAEVYVYSEKNSKEVLFIVENDTVILSDEDAVNIERTVLPNDLEFYALTEAYIDYKLSGNKFILNTKKISDRENKKIDDKIKSDKKDSDFLTAKAKLMNATWIPLTDEECESLR